MKRDLTEFTERLAMDSEFVELLKKEPEKAAKAMGWSPKELVTYKIDESAAKRNCGSVCGCDADTGTGCKASSGHGTNCKPGAPGQVHECPYSVG